MVTNPRAKGEKVQQEIEERNTYTMPYLDADVIHLNTCVFVDL
jgi:hypothetical protein